MDRVLDNIVALVKQHSAGIPLKKLAVFYSQTYRQNLTLSSLGFVSMASLVASLEEDLVVEGELVIHKINSGAGQTEAVVSTKATENEKNKNVLENIVGMVKQHSSGIPLKKLSVFYKQTYHKNLTLSSLGFNSMVSLVASLDRNLVLVGQLVLHKDHCCESQAGAGSGASAKATKDNNSIEKVLENVEPVSEKSPTKDSRPATPLQMPAKASTSTSVTLPQVNVNSPYVPPTQAVMNILGPPLISAPLFSTLFTAPQQKLTQQQLYQRVLEVSNEDKIDHSVFFI